LESGLIRSAAPYVIGLLVAAVLYHLAGRIAYTPRPGLLGPDFWPKMAIGLMAAVCLIETVKRLAGFRVEARGVEEVLEEGAVEEAQLTYPLLLLGGVGLVVSFAFLVPLLGFLLTTFLFLPPFIYLGGYRNHLVVWSFSAIVTTTAAFVFLRVAYVSLPRGEPPFDRFTDFVRVMLGG
jgi:hypothetical protein